MDVIALVGLFTAFVFALRLGSEHLVQIYIGLPSAVDTAGKWPYREDVTSDFMYLRLHGEEELYASGYTEEALDRWAARIRAWSTGSEPADAERILSVAPSKRASRDIYCYFDNDIKVKAPFDAQRLIKKLGLENSLDHFTLQSETKTQA